MSGARGKPTGLVADADVLIDYADADKSVLTLISRHVATLHVASPVLDEVCDLELEEAQELGIIVVEPTLSQVMEAQAGGGRTSFQDRLCFILARDEGLTVFSNDGALRSVCIEADIPCLWGMEAMVILVRENHLSTKRAMSLAEKIARNNPFITQSVMDRLRERIGLQR